MKNVPRKQLSKKERFEVLARCGFSCVYCGRRPPEVVLHVDHGLPVAAGGTNDGENLVAACFDCNTGKRARIFATAGVTFRRWLRAQVGRDDMVGDLADDEKRTPLDGDPKSYKELMALVREKKVGVEREVAQAIWHAWREFRRGGRVTRLIAEFYNEREDFHRKGEGVEHLKAGLVMQHVFWPYDGGAPTWIGDGDPPKELEEELGHKIKRGKLRRY